MQVPQYQEKLPELEAYLVGHWLTDFANFSAFVFQSMPAINWTGFYLSDDQSLKLGPFAGKPACTEIRFGRGVCGTAFSEQRPLLVPDVVAFPGHIACDSASRSEMVIPLAQAGKWFGVFDLDSPDLERFGPEDLAGVQLWLRALLEKVPVAQVARRPWSG